MKIEYPFKQVKFQIKSLISVWHQMTAHQFERRGEEKFTAGRRHRTYFRLSVGRYVALKSQIKVAYKELWSLTSSFELYTCLFAVCSVLRQTHIFLGCGLCDRLLLLLLLCLLSNTHTGVSLDASICDYIGKSGNTLITDIKDADAHSENKNCDESTITTSLSHSQHTSRA